MRQIGRWWSVQAVSNAKSKCSVLRLRFFKTTFFIRFFIWIEIMLTLDLMWFGYIIVTIIYMCIFLCLYTYIHIQAVPSHHHPLLKRSKKIHTLTRSVWEREKRWWNWRIAIWSSLELVLHSIPPSYTLLGGRIFCDGGGNPRYIHRWLTKGKDVRFWSTDMIDIW